MKVKTAELTGPALNYAVGIANGWVTYPTDSIERGELFHTNKQIAPLGYDHNKIHRRNYKPSTDWAQGGPILTEARISRTSDPSGLWVAYWTGGYADRDGANKCMQCDRSELVAGLRCYVALELGEEVEIPDELTPTEPAITLNRQAVWPFR